MMKLLEVPVIADVVEVQVVVVVVFPVETVFLRLND